jgi:hypothetical protein
MGIYGINVSKMMMAGKNARKIRTEIADARVASCPFTIDSAKNEDTYHSDKP